jgi:hypothetical protein
LQDKARWSHGGPLAVNTAPQRGSGTKAQVVEIRGQVLCQVVENRAHRAENTWYSHFFRWLYQVSIQNSAQDWQNCWAIAKSARISWARWCATSEAMSE